MASSKISLARLTQASLARQVRRVSRMDPMLAEVVDRYGAPPLWQRPEGFATLLRIILEQQVSLDSAAAVFGRLKLNCDGRITCSRILDLEEQGLRKLGVTRQKARYISLLAENIKTRRLSLPSLRECSYEQACERLLKQTGIGPWTAEVYLLMCLCYQDAFPIGDLALLREMESQLGCNLDWQAAESYALKWRPLRAVGTRILWQAYLAKRDRL